jgi:2-haloacid dehalogenase
MNRVQKGDLPWTSIDGLHRQILNELLKKYAIKGLSEEETDRLNRVWHRLLPWPDSVSGLNRLRSRYVPEARILPFGLKAMATPCVCPRMANSF